MLLFLWEQNTTKITLNLDTVPKYFFQLMQCLEIQMEVK